MMSDDRVGWLLDSDPALRWQVERDLAHAPEDVWRATRARIATEGFGARLLALQDPDGQWAGGAFFPADFDFAGPEAAEDAGQPWTATTWVLNTLPDWGLDAAVLDDTAERLALNSRWEYDNLPYWGGEVDCCINAWTVANVAWLGVDVSGLVAWFLEHQLTDGGEEYLLRRNLDKRLSTGEPVGPWVLRFAYPFRWFYSVLNAAEYFREASLLDDQPPDRRIAEAIELIRAARRPDGTWLPERRHPGRVWFQIDVDAGEPSKWLTHSATRVLECWDAS